MFVYAMNGLGEGPSLTQLKKNGMDPGILRPFMEIDRRTGLPTGRSLAKVVARNPYTGQPVYNEKGEPQKRVIVVNSPTTMLEQDWKDIDKRVEFAAKQRLRLFGDVYGANPYNIANGMGTIAITNNTAIRNATAMISMDPIRRGRRSRPLMETTIMPLPCTHSDGGFTSREIAVTANNPSMRLDTSGIEGAARVVAETTEHLFVGDSSFTYAGGTIYGLRNAPNRFTKVLSQPTGSNGPTIIAQIASMLQTLKDNFFYGPYIAYMSNAYQQWLMQDYTTTYAKALWARIQEATPEITAWRPLDFLTGYQIILVQMTSDVIEAVQGMPITTVQWTEQGGFEECFKVLCIQVPRVKTTAYGTTGIMHGAVP